MINSIQLKFGKAPGQAIEPIAVTPITVFVGPNNSGKSKILAEIHRYCTIGRRDASDVILEDLSFQSVTATIAEERIRHVTLSRRAGEMLNPDHIIVGKRGQRLQVRPKQLSEALCNADKLAHQFCSWYLQYNTLMLDGKSRINLVSQQAIGDLQEPPHTSFQSLFRDCEKREQVRRVVHDAFGQYLVLDPTNVGHIRLRLSTRPPHDDREECGIHNEAVAFHRQAQLIDHASDGVKAFTGMLAEIAAGDPSILLIDEPEAFLHPSLAFKLGKEIAQTSMRSDKRLFVSTHSPNFVMGCIQSGAQVTIVRLTYRDRVATARVLPNADILRLMRNPLLRSTGVLGGLFYEFVVVTESDTDRAFYQEINERLSRSGSGRGIPNCLFINAQNKQTVRTIVRPLRELGIPAVGVVDIDVVKDGGADWKGFLEAGFLPALEREALGISRAKVKQKFEGTSLDMKRDGGVDLLSAEDKEATNNLFDRLAEYGLFVVRRGELESWLPKLGVSGKGPQWLIGMFERMGEDPSSPDYIQAADDDVWVFVEQMKGWLTNPGRKGIPS